MKIIYPKRIVKTFGNIESEKSLLTKKPLQIGLNETDCAILHNQSSVILDFGKEITGTVRILTFFIHGSKKVRIRLGESITESMAELGEKNATNDHSNRDMFVELQNYSDMRFMQSGFRFLKLDVLDGTEDIKIKSIVVESDIDSRKMLGSFETNDKLLNKIWQTAGYTLRLCIKNGYLWDGVKRDRLVWIGDLYPEMRSLFSTFGAIDEIKKSLIFSKDQTPLPNWINSIPSYSIWWIIIFAEYVDRTNDKEFYNDNIDYVDGIIAMLDDFIKEGSERYLPWNFIDWPSHYDGEKDDKDKEYDENIGIKYLIIFMLDKIKKLYDKNNKQNHHIDSLLYKISKNKKQVRKYKQIAGLGVMSGDKSENNLQVMLKGKEKGLSTFMNYFIFSALDKYDKQLEIIEMMKAYYGKMLYLGATTFWEDFDAEWTDNAFGIDKLPRKNKKDIHGDFGKFCYIGFRHSLCHGWASGVLAYMSECILGVKFVSYNHYKIEPNLDGLEYVKGTYPTEKGLIKIEVTKKVDGTLNKKIEAPQGIIVE